MENTATIQVLTQGNHQYSFLINENFRGWASEYNNQYTTCSGNTMCFFFNGTISGAGFSNYNETTNFGVIVVDSSDTTKGKYYSISDAPGANTAQDVNISDIKSFDSIKTLSGVKTKIATDGYILNTFIQFDQVGPGFEKAIEGNLTTGRKIKFYETIGGETTGKVDAEISPSFGTSSDSLSPQITLKQYIFSNTSYTLEFPNSSERVGCLTGDTGAVSLTCNEEYSAKIIFYLDNSGNIHFTEDTANDTFEKSQEGKRWIDPANSGSGKISLFQLSMTGEFTSNSPLDKALSGTIKTLAGWVGSFTKTAVVGINNLLDGTTNIVLGEVGSNKKGVEAAWTKMRNIALTLLIMALIIIAFANVLQIDIEQYGLNRMIPKIIISIIMAYLSWIIVTFFFDFAKALQDQAWGLLNGGKSGSGLEALRNINITTPTTGDILGKAGAVLVLLVLLIGILICLIVLWFSLLMRVVVLSFLLAVAPLAFILNIMPFTSNLYKQWWSEFFKWMFMGPIAVVIIALGSVIASGSFGFTGSMTLTGDSTVEGAVGYNVLIGLLIFGASIYLAATLPMQWGGKIMQGWGKFGKGARGLASKIGVNGWSPHRVGNMAKGWLSQRKAGQDAVDSRRLKTGLAKVAGSGVPGARWAATGVSGQGAETAAEQLHMAAVQAAHDEFKMDDKNSSKETLMGLTNKKYSRNVREAAVRELASRGLLDMDAAELKQWDGAEGGDKQSLFNEFVQGNGQLRNIAMDKHKDLILGSGEYTSGDFKNKALNKIMDSSLTSITSAEMAAVGKYAGGDGMVESLGAGNYNIDNGKPKNADGSERVFAETAQGSIDKKEAQEQHWVDNNTFTRKLMASGMSRADAIDKTRAVISAQKVISSWTPQQVAAVMRNKGQKRMGAIETIMKDVVSGSFLDKNTIAEIMTKGIRGGGTTTRPSRPVVTGSSEPLPQGWAQEKEGGLILPRDMVRPNVSAPYVDDENAIDDDIK